MTSHVRPCAYFIGILASVLLVSGCSILRPSSDLQLTETSPTAYPTQTTATAPQTDPASTELPAPKRAHTPIDDDHTPDILASTVNNYKCELNDSLTLYTNNDDDNRAAIRWKNKLYGLKRVETTTGANRFENKKAGLVWISIPTKGMLLDSKRGQQLANECKTASQLK